MGPPGFKTSWFWERIASGHEGKSSLVIFLLLEIAMSGKNYCLNEKNDALHCSPVRNL